MIDIPLVFVIMLEFLHYCITQESPHALGDLFAPSFAQVFFSHGLTELFGMIPYAINIERLFGAHKLNWCVPFEI